LVTVFPCLKQGDNDDQSISVFWASKKADSKLMVDAGQAASRYQDRVLVNLCCKRIQVDEIWAFVYAKQKNVATAKATPDGAGDVWTWTAIDADTKLIPSWFVGGRDSDAAIIFMDDLASRLANRVQLTSDGHKAYLEAVEAAFGSDIDYATLVKLYGAAPESAKGRYSTPQSAWARTRSGSKAIPIPSTSRLATRNDRTSAFGCTLAVLLGSPTPSQRRSKTTRIRSRYSRCTTISFASIRRCGPHLLWPLASHRGFGKSVIM
jgi:hypothetical protein